MRQLVATVVVSLSVISCSEVVDQPQDAAEALAWASYGDGVTDGEFMSMADVVAKKDEYDGETVRVEGAVESVCKVKGCWMTMDGGDEEVRVTFQDYGFFVPLDCEGRKTQLVGEFKIAVTPAADVRHYLEDAGKTEEAALVTEDKLECVFVATGVRMEPAPKAAATPSDSEK